jgi:hypothetical protein
VRTASFKNFPDLSVKLHASEIDFSLVFKSTATQGNFKHRFHCTGNITSAPLGTDELRQRTAATMTEVLWFSSAPPLGKCQAGLVYEIR